MSGRTARADHAFPADQLERLAQRVIAGEVAFFIGAGFSLDSEGNSAWRLAARLLARFEAMAACLQDVGDDASTALASDLREAMRRTFALTPPAADSTAAGLDPDNITKLANQYYLINDWFCSAYGKLIEHFQDIDIGASDLAERLGKTENGYLKKALKDDAPYMLPFDLDSLKNLTAMEAGKALFLDTMGFDDSNVMAGDPCHVDLGTVAASYGTRLRPRHRVLARLAMEGWSPMLITTNYDLLIEGAYRLAGMAPPRDGEGKTAPAFPLSHTYGQFDRIAAASQFFAGGKGHRTALIVKMHGCVESYRKARCQSDACKAYLPAMVFTFREIQHWREDSWSRDLLRTLLRTRTVVFSGYSTQDPVVHDTVRSVYEEMHARRDREEAMVQAGGPTPVSSNAPAFLFEVHDTGNFHGTEILRAAAKAVGVANPSLTDWPNLVGFKLPGKTGTAFPSLDEEFRWLLHLALRERQRQTLDGHLGAVAAARLGHPCHEDDLKGLRERLDAVIKWEKKASRGWTDSPESRRVFERMCAWTERFHFALLRELAAAEVMRRGLGPGASHRAALKARLATEWYCPMLDHPDWTVWAVVLELALRQLAADWHGRPGAWADTVECLRANAAAGAQVDFYGGSQAPSPIRLSIGLDGLSKPDVAPLSASIRKHVHWPLPSEMRPWQIGGRGCPSVMTLWHLALGNDASVAGDTGRLLDILMGKIDV